MIAGVEDALGIHDDASAGASVEERRERERDDHHESERRATVVVRAPLSSLGGAAHGDTCAVRAGAVAVGLPRSG